MPTTNVTLWLPDGRPHFMALLEQARVVARSWEDPTYIAGMDQASAALTTNLARTGVQVRLPGVGEGFLLGVMVGLATVQANPDASPGWVAGAVMSYALRAVEGPAVQR